MSSAERLRIARRLFLYGQVSFYAGLVLCIFLLPGGISANNGISYYGIYLRTIVPYVAMFSILVFYLWKTAAILPDEPGLKLVRRALWLYAPLLIGVMVTPYSVNPFLGRAHQIFGTVTFATQLALTAWLTLTLVRDWQSVALFIIQFFSGLSAFWSMNNRLHYLFSGQVVFQIAFALFMMHVFDHFYRVAAHDRPHVLHRANA